MNKKHWNVKGGKMPERVRKLLSKKVTGKYVGEKHPRWLGGKKVYLKRQAKKRDNNTCQRCGYHDSDFLGSAVDVDHILSRAKYPQLEFVLDNLITLCPNCHRIKTLRERDVRNGAALLKGVTIKK